MNALYLFAALAAGMGIAVQAAVNSRLAAELGSQPLMGALISFAVGTLALALIACWQADWPQALAQAGRQPWWHWTGGLLGACFVFMTVFLAPRIGLTQMAFIMIVGQLLMGLLIDSHGLLHMPAPRHRLEIRRPGPHAGRSGRLLLRPQAGRTLGLNPPCTFSFIFRHKILLKS